MLSPKEVADLYHLEVRIKLIEIAAIYDRYDRANKNAGTTESDARFERSKKALES